MNIEETEIKILSLFEKLRPQELSSWIVTKKMYPSIASRDLNTQYKAVKRTLGFLEELQLILSKEKSGNIFFKVNSSRVKFSKHRFPSGLKDALYVKCNGLWIVYELQRRIL